MARSLPFLLLATTAALGAIIPDAPNTDPLEELLYAVDDRASEGLSITANDETIVIQSPSGDSYTVPLAFEEWERLAEESFLSDAAAEDLSKDIDLSEHTILEILNRTVHAPLHPDSDFEKKHGKVAIRKFARVANWTGALGEHGWWNVIADHEERGIEYTLLIPDDEALTPKRRGRRHHGVSYEDVLAGLAGAPGVWDAEDIAFGWGEPQLEEEDDFYTRAESLFPPGLIDLFSSEDESEQAKLPQEKRERLLKVANALLYHHSVPYSWTLGAIADQSTLETRFPSFIPDEENGERGVWDRVRVSTSVVKRWIPGQRLRGVDINFYASVRGKSIRAKNGYIHTISKPLFPPLSVFREMLLFPNAFSTATSSIQEVHVQGALNPDDRWFVHPGSNPAASVAESLIHELEGDAMKWTVFAPSNGAWAKIPMGLQAFLHSPFPVAKKLLKAVLEYHGLPDVQFHTDHHPSVEPYLVSSEVQVPITAEDPIWKAIVEGESERLASSSSSDFTPASSSDPLESYFDVASAHANKPKRHYSVEHYSIPTALFLPLGDWDSEDPDEWVQQELKVAVVKYRSKLLGGHLQRRLVVQSYRGKNGESEWDSVFVPDIPVRGGAIHLVTKVIVPPFKKWHDENGDDDDEGEDCA